MPMNSLSSEDELAGKSLSRPIVSGLLYPATSFIYPATTSSLYHLEEPETSDEFAASFSYPTTTTSFLYETSYNNEFSKIQEESEISTDELAKPTLKSVPSKRPFKGLGRQYISRAFYILHRTIPSSSQSTTTSSYQALPSTTQLATSSVYQAVPSMYQSGSTTLEYPSTTTVQYTFPSIITNSNLASREGQQDDDDNEYKDDIDRDIEIP